MKVAFEDKKIKIRRGEGVVLVCDNSVSFDLIDVVIGQIRQLDIAFKLGGLSLKEELTEKDFEDLKHKVKNRGRFVAPLIEGFFQNLPDKKYDLIILHSGKIYDLKDFNRELSTKFGKMVIKNIDEQANWSIDKLRGFLKKEVFDFSIDCILLSFLSPAVPYEWDSDFSFSLSLDTTQQFVLRYTGEKGKKCDVNLKIRGKSEETDVEVNVNGSKFKGKLKNDKTFISPQWRLLSDEDIKNFRKHLEGYKNNNFNIECPLCSKKHLFNKPFFCEQSKDDVLTGGIFSGGCMILENLRSYQTGFIFFKCEESEIKYLSSEKDILEYEELRFVFVPKSTRQVYEVICKDDTLNIKEAVKISDNLFELENDKIIYLV